MMHENRMAAATSMPNGDIVETILMTNIPANPLIDNNDIARKITVQATNTGKTTSILEQHTNMYSADAIVNNAVTECSSSNILYAFSENIHNMMFAKRLWTRHLTNSSESSVLTDKHVAKRWTGSLLGLQAL